MRKVPRMLKHIAILTTAVLIVLGSRTAALSQPQPPVSGTDYFTNARNTPLTALVSELLTNDIPDPLNPPGAALTMVSVSSTSAHGGSVTMLSGSWTNIYDAEGASDDRAYTLKVDDSGNVYVTGRSHTNGGAYDFLTIKYSSAGLALWTNRLNGTGISTGDHTMAVDGSGNVYVTGSLTGSGSIADFATIKYSGAGVAAWTNRFNGASNGADKAYSLAVDGSGNVYVTGESYGGSSYSDGGSDDDFATIKYSSAGAALWTNVFNGDGNGYDFGRSLAVDVSGNVFVTGYSTFPGRGLGYATIKYSIVGVPVWTNLFYAAGNRYGDALLLTLDGNGDVYIMGYSLSGETGYDYATIKYSNAGEPLWTNLFNGAVNGEDTPESMAVDGSSNVYVTGSSAGSEGGTDFATIKYSSTGGALWTNRYSSAPASYKNGLALGVDASDNVYVTGTAGIYDFSTIKYSSAGEPAWTNRFNGAGNSWDFTSSLDVDGRGNVYVTGSSFGGGSNSFDYATIKYSTYAGSPAVFYAPPTNFTGTDTFTYVVRDSLGLTATGTVSVAVVALMEITSQPLAGGDLRLASVGIPGWNYALDRTFSLAPPNWIPQMTNPAGTSGALVFTNTPDSNTNNFWRIRSVP